MALWFPKVQRANGFTLVEIMIVVAIIGLTAALAGPNVFQWMQRYELRQATTTLVARLQAARVTAINQNRPIIVTICLYPTAPCNTAPPPMGGGSVQATFAFQGGAIALPTETLPSRIVNFALPAAGPITFNSRGGMNPGAGPQTIQLLTSLAPVPVGYSVTVNPAGKVSWCAQLLNPCP